MGDSAKKDPDSGVEVEFGDNCVIVDGTEISIQAFARAAMEKVQRHEEAIYALQKHRTIVEVALEEVMACYDRTTGPSSPRGGAAMLTASRALGKPREARNASREEQLRSGAVPFLKGDVIHLDGHVFELRKITKKDHVFRYMGSLQ